MENENQNQEIENPLENIRALTFILSKIAQKIENFRGNNSKLNQPMATS